MATGDSLVQGNQDAAAKLGISLPGVGSGTQTANVAGNQAAAAKLGVNISGVNGATPPPPVPQTQNAASINNNLSGGTSGTIFPPAPPAPHTNGTSANTSIPNPTPNGWDPQTYANFKAANPGIEPTAQDTAQMQSGSGIASPSSIIDQGNQQTPAETANKNLLQQVADLIKNKKGQTTLTNTAEAQAGIPALQKTVNDLNTQLEGLNNQATDLQNQASPGGAIENQNQQNALGRGITAAGLAPQTAGDLRKNQIQQSAIASQALTLKSAIYGAQGNLTLAKDAADKAALAQYEDQQNQIDYQKALIDANLPQMNKEEKNQALLVQTQLADRQQQIADAKDDKKTIIAMATAVLQGQPNNPQAQYAAQQALAESNKQQPDLQKVLGFIGGYQTLDTQLKVAQIAQERATTAKTALETKQIKQTGGGTQTITDSKGAQVNVPNNVAPYVNTSSSGIHYVDASTVQGTASQKKAVVDAAQAAGLKVITNKNTVLDLTNISDANSKLDSIATIMSGIDQPNFLSRDLAGLGLTKLASAAQSNPQQAAAGALSGVGLDILKAISGVQGFRGNSAVVQQITDHLPNIYDSNATVQTKVQYIRTLISDRENAILGSNGTNTSSATTRSGKPFDVSGAKAAGYTDAQIQAYLTEN